MLGLDAYFRTYLLSDCQEVTYIRVLLHVFVYIEKWIDQVNPLSHLMVISPDL